jgi:hypothetical protein
MQMLLTNRNQLCYGVRLGPLIGVYCVCGRIYSIAARPKMLGRHRQTCGQKGRHNADGSKARPLTIRTGDPVGGFYRFCYVGMFAAFLKYFR